MNHVIEVIKVKQLKMKYKVESGIKGDQLTSSCLLLSNSTSYPLTNNSGNAVEMDHLARMVLGGQCCPLGRNIEVLALSTPDTHSKILNMSEKYIPLCKL